MPDPRRLIGEAVADVLLFRAGTPLTEGKWSAPFKSILSSADADKDGKLSIRECFAIRKDRKTAEKNCRSWNADDDGRMTQDGYVRQS